MPLFGPSRAVRELREAIGKEQFDHLKKHGYYLVESGGRRFALNAAGIIAVDAPDHESWFRLCVSPVRTGEENVPGEDMGIMMYRWVQANPTRLLEVANRTAVIQGRDFNYRDIHGPSPDPMPYEEEALRYITDTCLRNDLNRERIAILRYDLPRSVIRRASQDFGTPEDRLLVRDLRPRDLSLCEWGEEAEWPSESTPVLTMGDMKYVCIYGMAVDPLKGRVMSVRIVVGGTIKCEWDCSLLYIPRSIVEIEGRREIHYSPVGYSNVGIWIPQNTAFQIRVNYLEPSPVIPIGFTVEQRGRSISP